MYAALSYLLYLLVINPLYGGKLKGEATKFFFFFKGSGVFLEGS